MFQVTDLLLTKPFNDLSAVVGSVGNVAAENLVVNFGHIESKVVFQTIKAPNDVTRIIVFGGSIIHVVDSTTTRIYNVNLQFILTYEFYTYPIPIYINSLLTVTPVNFKNTPINILPDTPVFNVYSYSYDFSTTIGFTCESFVIKANIVLQKSYLEGIVNGSSLIPIEFYLVTPVRGNLPFLESSYSISKNPNGLTEVTQLVGVLVIIPKIGNYTVVLDLTREFATSTDPQAKSITSGVTIRNLNNFGLPLTISGEKVENDSVDKFYIYKFQTEFITGSFAIPSNRNWNSKPQDLTFNYQSAE